MKLAPYRRVLAEPGVARLMLVGMLARVPATAAGMTVTLHVVTELELGYAEAGVAGALNMIGAGIGSPLAGRLVDRVGVRPVMLVTTAAQAGFWAFAPHVGYGLLVASAFLAGVLSLPVFSVMRQFMAAMVPVSERRTAFALDSMAVELSFMVGPALAVAGVTGLGSRATMYSVGAGFVVAGLALAGLNPPIRSAAEEAAVAGAVPRRQWLTPRMVVLLGVTTATTFILAATELSIVAMLRAFGVTSWTGVIIALWCGYSLVGGFVYGALRSGQSPLVLVAVMGVLTAPVGLLTVRWWWLPLLLLPAGLLCAPSLTSTVDTVSRWVPAGARGEAMGLHGTALTIGVALGAPAAGAVIDAAGPAWGFAVAGGVGVLMVAAALPFWPRERGATTAEAPSQPLATVASASTDGA
jgi:MFS family permease